MLCRPIGRSFRHTALTLSLALLGSACGSDSAVAPAAPEANLDQLFAELSMPGVTAATASLVSIPGGAAAASWVPSRCTFTASLQRFTCPDQSLGGLTVTQSFALLTASGAPQAAFDASTTAAVRTNSTIKGTVSERGSSITIDGQQELTLSGLLTGAHTINGTSTVKLDGSLASTVASIPLNGTITTTIANLVLPRAGAGQWPLSGTVAVATVRKVAGLGDLPVRVQLTFNGTSTVTLAISTNDAPAATCTVDLASPRSGASCGRLFASAPLVR